MSAVITSAEDLAMLRDMARDWVTTAAPLEPDPQAARAAGTERWQAIAELGWVGATISEELGGLGFGVAAVGMLLEALAGTLTTTPLLSTGLIAAQALGNRPEAAALAAGERIVALAIDESGHHGKPFAARAEMASGRCAVSGAKRFVLDAARADFFLVAAKGSSGIDLFLVDGCAAEVIPLDMIDGRDMGDVVFTAAAAEPLGLGGAEVDWLCDLARVGLAAEMVGAAEFALRTTVDYLKLREQFGRPIGSFQALQHRAAHWLCDLELARAAVAEAWAAAESRSTDFAQLAALAKFMAGEAMHASVRARGVISGVD